MKSSLVQRLLTAIAIVALAGLLAFGGGIRYLCYCAGSAVMTAHEHCHGDHGEAGPVDHAAAGHRHDHGDGHGQDESEDHGEHHHEVVKSSTDLRLPDVVTAPEAKFIPLLWTALSEGVATRAPESAVESSRPPIEEPPPPLSHRVARAVVRLI